LFSKSKIKTNRDKLTFTTKYKIETDSIKLGENYTSGIKLNGEVDTGSLFPIKLMTYKLHIKNINNMASDINSFGTISNIGINKNIKINNTTLADFKNPILLPMDTIFPDVSVSNISNINLKFKTLNNIKSTINSTTNILANKIESSYFVTKGVDISFPFHQSFTIDSLGLILDNNQTNFMHSENSNIKIDSLIYLLEYDKIFITNISGKANYDNLKFNLFSINGLMIGGNFSGYLDYLFDKKLILNLKNSESFKLINILDSSKVEFGVEAKRLDISILQKRTNPDDKDYQINMNSVNSFDIYRGFSVINSDINLTKIGYKASTIVNNKLFQYTKDNNIKLLNLGVKLGYGINRLNINIIDNMLNTTVYMRNDASRIIPFFVTIKPSKYKIINSFPFTDIGILNESIFFNKKDNTF